MTRAEQVAELARRFEEWAWGLPAAELVPREGMFLADCRGGGVYLEEVLADPDQLDETLALALQKRFFAKLVFVELFDRRYENRMLQWLSKFDPDEHRRGDIVQELYVKFWKPVRSGESVLPGFDPSQVFRSWLYVALRNLWIAKVARERRPCLKPEWDTHGGPDTVEQEILYHELAAELTKALTALSPEHQAAMERRLDGRDAAQIAEELALPIGRVYRLLHRARQWLAQRLDVILPPSHSGRKPKQVGAESQM